MLLFVWNFSHKKLEITGIIHQLRQKDVINIFNWWVNLLAIFHHLEKNKKTGKMGERLHSDCLLPWGEEQKWKDSRVKSSWASDSLQRPRVCSAAELPLAVSTGVLASPRCILLGSDDRIQNIAFSVFDYRCVKSVVDYSLLLHLSTYCIFTPLLSRCSSSTHSVYLAVFQSLKVKSLHCSIFTVVKK